MRALSVLELREEGLVVAKREKPPEDWRRITVFDLDGVLVDPSERLRRALEMAGLQPPVDDLPDDEGIRTRFFKELFSPETLKLDKPIEEALKMLEYRMEDGSYLAVVSGRPESLIEASAKVLDNLGIGWHMLIHRARGNNKLEGLLKAHAFKTLLPRAREYHDDRLENLVLADSASLIARLFRHTDNFWYNVPGRALQVEWSDGRRMVDSTELAVQPQIIGYPARISWMSFNTIVDDPGKAARLASKITVLRGIFRRHSPRALHARPSSVVTMWTRGARWRIPVDVLSIARTLDLRI